MVLRSGILKLKIKIFIFTFVLFPWQRHSFKKFTCFSHMFTGPRLLICCLSQTDRGPSLTRVFWLQQEKSKEYSYTPVNNCG